MEQLQLAMKESYRDLEKMKKDNDLDPLRDREDFKKYSPTWTMPQKK